MEIYVNKSELFHYHMVLFSLFIRILKGWILCQYWRMVISSCSSGLYTHYKGSYHGMDDHKPRTIYIYNTHYIFYLGVYHN